MSLGDGTKIIAIKIPDKVTVSFVKEIKNKAKNIDYEISYIMNKYFSFDIENIDISGGLDEEDLFKLKDDSLKIKKASISYLLEAIDETILSRVANFSRLGTDIGRKDISCFELGGSTYLAAACFDGYHYSKNSSEAYNYILAINISGVLD